MEKTTEQYFKEFYEEVRFQTQQAKPNYLRANQIWAEYEAAEQSVQADLDYYTCKVRFTEKNEAGEWICNKCHRPCA